MLLSFPFQIGPRGRSQETHPEGYLRGVIEQILFTAPGERVNRPEQGIGLRELVFSSPDKERTAALQMMIRGALQEQLGQKIQVEEVSIETEEAQIRVSVHYITRHHQQPRVEHFERS